MSVTSSCGRAIAPQIIRTVDALLDQPTGMVQYLLHSINLHVCTVAGTFDKMELIKVLLLLLLEVVSQTVCLQDSPCNEGRPA